MKESTRIYYRYGPYGVDHDYGTGSNNDTFAGKPEAGPFQLRPCNLLVRNCRTRPTWRQAVWPRRGLGGCDVPHAVLRGRFWRWSGMRTQLAHAFATVRGIDLVLDRATAGACRDASCETWNGTI